MNPIFRYKNADEAFVDMYKYINTEGFEAGNGTKSIINANFYIMNPMDNLIKCPERKWNMNYAAREWNWYLSQNRSVEELKKFAPIWDKMHGGDNIVNSNYGFLWNENEQLPNIIKQLEGDTNTRQAWVTLYDGKKKSEYEFDTPCTLNVGFRIINEKLCMSVLMRSNDLWYGFCNDQFCFSLLQKMVACELNLEVGWYYHYAADLHIYEKHYNLIK